MDYDAVEGTEYISIHSARVGGDASMYAALSILFKFQSTPPVWAETKDPRMLRVRKLHFNPLRPCGRRL